MEYAMAVGQQHDGKEKLAVSNDKRRLFGCNQCWSCELDDRFVKTSPKIFDVNMCCTHNGLEDIVKVFDPNDEDWIRLNHIDQHRASSHVKHLEDGGRCTKWKSPGHIWLEVPPDDVITEFGGSDRPFIMDQTFCLTRPLRCRLVEDNKVSAMKRPDDPQYKRNRNNGRMMGETTMLSTWNKESLSLDKDFESEVLKVGGNKGELTSSLRRLEELVLEEDVNG